MYLPFFLLAVLAPAASTGEQPVPAPAPAATAPSQSAEICPRDLLREASAAPARARRLGELPPGDLQLTVIRRVGECHEPVIIRQGFGAVAEERRR